ncbi:MAG TPA: APC family permease [Thermoanaerobaculia bacterium]|jgi:amino acid transporter|nr:APC family permease [Thermoanaerobaculia bacterium]
MSEPVTVSQPGFRRAVSRWEIVAFSLNDVIGSGVYLLPAAAAAVLGPTSVWAVVLAGFAVALLVLCFAEAGSYFDRPGGAYLYTREAFGELVGFEVGWMTWLARVSSVASLSVGFAQALGYLWPQTAAGTGRTLAIVLPLLLLTMINIVGVKSGVRTAVFLAVTKIVPLLIFVGVGIFYVSRTLATLPTPRTGTLGEAALLLLFAYAGFENTAAPAGEFKNPRRDIPFALVANITIVTLIYTAVQWVALGTLPNLVESKTPLADAAQIFLGGWGGLLLTVGAVLSILGTNSNTVLAGPRYLWALAADGFGPRALTYIHPTFRTPTVAILAQTAIALPLALSGSFTQLATLSVIARLATYFGTAAAVLKLRRKFPDAANIVRTPGGPVIPIAALLLCVAFAASAEARNLIAGAIAVVVGLGLYAIRRRGEANSDKVF